MRSGKVKQEHLQHPKQVRAWMEANGKGIKDPTATEEYQATLTKTIRANSLKELVEALTK